MIQEDLIEDIKRLSKDEVCKLYKYVRTHMIADIKNLPDPLEREEVPHLEDALKNLIKEYADLLEDAKNLFDYPTFPYHTKDSYFRHYNLPSVNHYFRDEDRLLKKLTEEYLK